MHIAIAERLKPYSHLPGTTLILPGSPFRIKVFPGRFEVDDLTTSIPIALAQVNLRLSQPMEQFTVEQDLEKGCVRVWGKIGSALFRYHLTFLPEQEAILISVEKAPEVGVPYESEGSWTIGSCQGIFTAKQCVLLAKTPKEAENISNITSATYKLPLIDRLSLGNSKAQDWEWIRRRRNFAEIFPIWHRLGQLVPAQSNGQNEGTLSLLRNCKEAIAASAPEKILTQFNALFLAGFESALSPQLVDTNYQGIISRPEKVQNDAASPLSLLVEGAKLIRSLFIREDGNCLTLLPASPPEFHCGRLINVSSKSFGQVSVEWTKKAVRIATLDAEMSGEFILATHDGQKSCRVRQSYKDPGKRYQLGTAFNITSGQKYWFDQFMR